MNHTTKPFPLKHALLFATLIMHAGATAAQSNDAAQPFKGKIGRTMKESVEW